MARRLEQLGADYLAVASLDEGAELRVAGITAPILVLGQTPAEFAADVVRLRLTQTVWDLETARALSAAAGAEGRAVKIHLKADTGMSRLGLCCGASHLEQTAEAMAARYRASPRRARSSTTQNTQKAQRILPNSPAAKLPNRE